MDRRDALKRIAAGGAVALGVTEIESSHAFADGGTVGRRPTNCSATPAITATFTNNRITLTVSGVAAPTCPAPGVAQAVQLRYRSNNTVRQNSAPATVLATPNTWSAFTTTILVVRITSAVSQTTLPAGTVSADVMTRRTCANGTRRAWCCVQRSRSGAWNPAGAGSWGGAFATVATVAAGCDSPVPT